MHFIIGHKSTDLISIVLMSSVRPAVPGAAPPPSDGASVVLPPAVMLHVTVAPHVAEHNIPSQQHGETPDAPLPHIDVFVVVSVVTSLHSAHDAAGGEVPHGQPAAQLAQLHVHQLGVLEENRRLRHLVPLQKNGPNSINNEVSTH